MSAYLSSLPIGAEFSLPGTDVTGRLLRLGVGSATVKLGGRTRHVEIVGPDGQIVREFDAHKSQVTQWSLGTLVEPL